MDSDEPQIRDMFEGIKRVIQTRIAENTALSDQNDMLRQRVEDSGYDVFKEHVRYFREQLENAESIINGAIIEKRELRRENEYLREENCKIMNDLHRLNIELCQVTNIFDRFKRAVATGFMPQEHHRIAIFNQQKTILELQDAIKELRKKPSNN